MLKGELAEYMGLRLTQFAAEGRSIRDAAEALGICYVTANKYAKELGVHFPHGLRGAGSKRSRNDEIGRRYLNGESQIDLSREFGISRERVRQICNAAGLVTALKRHNDFISTVAGAVQRKSLTAIEAAEMFGISKNSVYRYCHVHGVRPASMTAEEVAEFERLSSMAEGMSVRKVAGGDRAKEGRLARFMAKKGVRSGGRSKHDDFSERKRIVADCRSRGLPWGEVASRIAIHDGKPIGQAAIYGWARKHMPHLFEMERAA